tara:strand:- start:3402 stop:3872 length:471 start_codon:yes stop_codon:yes gene_type:complete
MRLKKGASLEGVTDITRKAIEQVNDVYANSTIMLWVTSGTEGFDGDGVHGAGSKHYTGEAFDCRTRNIPGGLPGQTQIYSTIKRVLGSDFDVILEKDHIHVEYDPKTKIGQMTRATKRVLTTQQSAVTLINLIGKIVTTLIPFYSQLKKLFGKFKK